MQHLTKQNVTRNPIRRNPLRCTQVGAPVPGPVVPGQIKFPYVPKTHNRTDCHNVVQFWTSFAATVIWWWHPVFFLTRVCSPPGRNPLTHVGRDMARRRNKEKRDNSFHTIVARDSRETRRNKELEPDRKRKMSN